MEFQLQKGQVSFVTEPTPRWIFSSPNRIDDRDLILFKDAISRVVKSLPGAIAYAQNLNCDGDNANQPDANEQILSLYQGRGDEGQILRMIIGWWSMFLMEHPTFGSSECFSLKKNRNGTPVGVDFRFA